MSGHLHKRWILSALFAAAGLSGFALALTSHGCSASPCTQAPGRKPSPSIECPAATVCYQGSCLPSCSSGAEGVEKCKSSDECLDSARPNCLSGFCSSCPEASFCLPELDICGPVGDLNTDAGERDAGRIEANKPLDGGAIDGSIFSRDSGEDIIIAIPPSHIGQVDLAQVVNARTGASTSSLAAEFFDVRGTGRIPSTTVADAVAIDGGRCELLSHDQFPNAAPIPADLGVINIEPGLTPGLREPFRATFGAGRYAIAPPPPANLLIFSTLVSPTSLFVSGPGQMNLTAGAWPTDRPSLHVPLELIVADETRALLSMTLRADALPGGVLTLRWERQSELSFPGSFLSVRIEGPTQDLICVSEEQPGQIRVPGTLLELFRQQPGLAPGTTLDLIFERAFGRQLEVPPAREGLRIVFTVSIRHSFVGRITF